MFARSIRNLARALAGATLLLALSAHAAADVSAKDFSQFIQIRLMNILLLYWYHQ